MHPKKVALLLAVAHRYLVDFIKKKEKKMKSFGRIEKLCTLFSTTLKILFYSGLSRAQTRSQTVKHLVDAYLRTLEVKKYIYESRSFFYKLEIRRHDDVAAHNVPKLTTIGNGLADFTKRIV